MMYKGFIEYKELLSHGVSEDALKKGITRNRQGKSISWQNTRDFQDKRKVLIYIKSIPERTRKKYNIPTTEEYEIQKEKEALERINLEKEIQQNRELSALLDAYENRFISHIEEYQNYLSYSKKQAAKYAIPYAREHAFWLRMVQITGIPKPYYGKLQEGFNMYCLLKYKIPFISPLSNIRYFRIKLSNIRKALQQNKSIADSIVDGSLKPRPYRMKVTDFHTTLMLYYLSHGQNYSYPVVTDLVNHHCLERGFKAISESAIKNRMNTDRTFRTLVEEKRHGAKYANDTIMPYTVRKVTPFPGNVWMIDGTPTQFFCWNETKTKVIRLYLFVVIDVCSRKISGFDISYSETRFNIMDALKMAVISEGYLPSEIVSDNFSASKTEEIKNLKQKMLAMGVNWRHSKVGNPQDKSYVERFFGTFQSVENSLYDGYIGEGITSKRNNRPSPEHIEKTRKEKDYLTVNQMKSQIATMIAKYNERSISGRPSPNKVCKSLPKPNAKTVDTLNTMLLFWKKTSYTVKRGMVKIKINKVEHVYLIKDHNLKMQLQNTKVAVRYDENAPERIMLFDYEHDTALCECKKEKGAAMTEVDKTPGDKSLQIATAKKKSYKVHIDKKRKEITDKGLESAGVEELELAHPLALKKNQVNTAESKLFLERYHYEQRITPDDEYKHNGKPIGKIKHSTVEDVRKELFETPIKKATRVASNKPV